MNQMMKLTRAVLVATVVVSLFAFVAPVEAGVGATDNVPAATLLLPYFEVDLSNPNGVTTLMSINNASATAVLAHVTVWTDLGVPTFAYNVYLTGYDVQTINVRDIFTGTVSRTASAGQDPGDTISNKGDISQDINFASCNGLLPPPALSAEYVLHLQRSHSGLSSAYLGNRCSARNMGDNLVRGYITVDTVNNCTLRVASDPGYFISGGVGDATNQNVLWGDYFFVNPAENFAQGDSLVHIEASATNPETSVAGEYTFYGRHVAWTAADNREPLAAVWASRFLNGGAFTGGTSLVGWRDSKVNQGTFNCGTTPSWYPLGQENIGIFDEQENVYTPPPVVFFPPPAEPPFAPLPAVSGKVRVAGSDFAVPYNFGWLYLNLNQTSAAAGANPPEDPAAAQSFVSTVMDAEGRFSVGFKAIALSSATNASHTCVGGGCN